MGEVQYDLLFTGEAQYDEVASPMRPVPSARKPQIKPKPGSKPAHQVDGIELLIS